MQKSAIISPCGRFRYRLDRHTPGAKHKVLWLMLNPSTADHEKDDPTIRKCMGFTERLGFKSLMVGNLATLRTPHPKELLAAMRRREDITGPDHLKHLSAMIDEATIVIAAWGRHGQDLLPLTGHVDGLLWNSGKEHFNIGRCLNMHPRHPLMVGYDDGLMEMAVPPREFGCAPLKPSKELLQKMLTKMASLRGEAM